MNDFNFYFTFGWQHILSINALDHLLFLVALTAIYVFKEWKQILILITAFTIGHTATLVLSVLDKVRFATNWVEFLIPCTIIFTALFNIVQRKKSVASFHLNYFLALLFGLVHGMGFANSIRFMLADNQNMGVSLLGFNLGIELGQTVVVALILLIATLMFSIFKISRQTWIIVLSVASGAMALKLAFERLLLIF